MGGLLSNWPVLVVVVVVIYAAWMFFNTVITKRFRNKAPGETESWVLGVFYYNPDDSRIFLPKRTGLGRTLNFAQPVAVLILCVLIVVVVVAILLD